MYIHFFRPHISSGLYITYIKKRDIIGKEARDKCTAHYCVMYFLSHRVHCYRLPLQLFIQKNDSMMSAVAKFASSTLETTRVRISSLDHNLVCARQLFRLPSLISTLNISDIDLSA